MKMISELKRLRQQWRDMNLRVEKLERRLRETDGIVDALLADAEYTPHRDLGMNGQHRRKEVVEELFEKLDLEQVLETGTYLGATTGYFASTFGVPVESSELIPRNHHFSRRSLRNLPNVTLHLQDSRSFLAAMADQPSRTSKRTFFYLDAHWYEDLPLEDEVHLIAEHWDEYVALIDDFQVPDDSGYSYDDYGDGKALTLDYLHRAVTRHDLRVYFPVAGSADETGRKRGYCVVAPPAMVDRLRGCGLLRESQATKQHAGSVGEASR